LANYFEKIANANVSSSGLKKGVDGSPIFRAKNGDV
jgi:hypothetical protein